MMDTSYACSACDQPYKLTQWQRPSRSDDGMLDTVEYIWRQKEKDGMRLRAVQGRQGVPHRRGRFSRGQEPRRG